MKLEVPFYPQTNATNCGLASLGMILSYFGVPFNISDLEKSAGIESGKGVYTIQLALAAARLGFDVTFFTKSLGINPEHLEMEFYKKYSSMNEERLSKIVSESIDSGVLIKETKLSLDEVLFKISDSCLALVLIDWNVILGNDTGEYQGHFVPIVGFDESCVYVHNPGPKDPFSFFAISREVFDRARISKGTDEDIIFIQKT